MRANILFFRSALILSALVFLLQAGSCRKKDLASRVNFTIDLTDPRYSQLNSTGGYVIVNNVIIARASNGALVAVSSFCTYDNTPLTFDAFSNEFVCPSDQSKFDINGNPTFGFASQPLIKYYTQLYGNSLQVYS